MRYLYYAIILLFVYFTAVQYNDPDPWLWIPTYLFPIYLVYKKMNKQVSNKTLILVAIPYLFWAINIFPPEWEGVMLNELGMKTINIELGRESLGLGITVFILLGLGLIKD